MKLNQQRDSLWSIRFCGRGLPNEANWCTLLTIGNGEIGIRGTVPELEPEQAPLGGVFLAGFYDALPRPELSLDALTPFVRSWSHPELVERYHLESALVNCPDFLDGSFEAEGERFALDASREPEIERALDMRTGEMRYEIPVCTRSGKHGLVMRRRLTHMTRTQMVYEHMTFTALDFDGEVCYHSRIAPRYANYNISGIYQDLSDRLDRGHVRLYDILREEQGQDIQTMRIRGRVEGTVAAFATKTDPSRFTVHRGKSVSLERRAVFACGTLHSTRQETLQALLDEAARLSYAQALNENEDCFRALWQRSDILIQGDEKAQIGIRHSLYQLLIAAPRYTDKVSVAAKGLSGEGYRGMVFWDTDIHMLPFYLYTQPEISQNIARFRINTLEGARAKAKKYGWHGACYPWETGVSGREECEDFLKLITHQLHITADVVYAVHQVESSQGPDALDAWKTARLYIETARFWLSRGSLQDNILTVSLASGPDELHLDSDNNAYLLHLAAKNLLLARDSILRLRSEGTWAQMRQETGISQEEATALLGYTGKTASIRTAQGVYEQCEGFFDLEDRIVYEDNVQDTPERTQTVKQADVLMLLYLMPELATEEALLANWNYYEPRTTHTSSLSYGVHGIIAAKLGLKDKAAYYLNRSLGIDLYSQGTSCKDGAHLAANGMSWSAIVNGLAGTTFDGETLRVYPQLPERWQEIAFRLTHSGKSVEVHVRGGGIQVTYQAGHGVIHVDTAQKKAVLSEGESL